MTRASEAHRAARISCVRAFGEGHGNRTRMGWVEAICLASRPGPRGWERCAPERASDGKQQGQRRLAATSVTTRKHVVVASSSPIELARARGLVRASSSQHSMEGALVAVFEQVVGIEPDDSGVAHQRVTSTLHLLGGLSRDLSCGSTLASGDASDVPCVGRVGIEPTFRRSKSPLQSQRLLPTRIACLTHHPSVMHAGEERRGMDIAIESRTCPSRLRPSPRS